MGVVYDVSGSYYEACNCRAVCPCRREGERQGGRSTYGQCDFVLSWRVVDGHVSYRDVSGLNTVMVGTYSDDDADSPWEVALWVDHRATDEQYQDLADVFLGRLGGDTAHQYAAAIAEVRGVYRAKIELRHGPGRLKIGVDRRILVRSMQSVPSEGAVTCGIPGHHQSGTELVADQITVDLDDFEWNIEQRASYQSAFRYAT